MAQVVELTISFFMEDKDVFTGVILCVGSADERWCYIVMLSLIGWAHMHNGLCIYYQYYGCCCCKTKYSEYFFLLYSHLDLLHTEFSWGKMENIFISKHQDSAVIWNPSSLKIKTF